MASYAKDILAIARDRRYRPETRGRRIGCALGLNDDELDALERAFVEQHEWTENRLSQRPEPKEPSDEAIALLSERSKNWIRDDDTDITAMLRLILNSPLFDVSRKEKKLITDKIDRIRGLIENHED